MMYPRLALLRELLREDGVVLISIGDDEIGHLRLLLDELYGEDNFIAHIVWQKRYVSNVTAQFLSDMHDHILVYARNAANVVVRRIERTEEQLQDYQNPDDDPRGPWRAQDLSASKKYAAGVFTIVGPTGREFNAPPSRYWRCSERQYKKWLSEKRIWFGKERESRPMLKAFLSESTKGLTPNTWWDYKFAGHNKEATLEMKALFDGESPFDTPKPLRLLRRILDLFTVEDSIVLDSFAGSGTTGHAVIAENKKDSGGRRYILIQQRYDTKDQENEKLNVCEQVTSERLRRAVAAEQADAGRAGFTYGRIGPPLFGEYRDFGAEMPGYDQLARYVFYTETSRNADVKNVDRKTGFIGSTDAAGGTSYYLRYSPDRKREGQEVSIATLKELFKIDKNKSWVIYCEKIWVHPDDLRQFQQEHHKTVRLMLVPFNLK